MIAVLGDNEVANSAIALRDRTAREQKDMKLDEFVELLKSKLAEVSF